MKSCPVCQRTYSDPSLSFCLEDGAVLVDQQQQPSGFGQSAGFGQQPVNFGAFQTPPVRKKSNAAAWILGIIGAFVILGGLGVVGIIALIAASGDANSNRRNANINSLPSNSSVILPGKNFEKVDFVRWGEFNNAGAQAKIVGNEYQLAAKQQGYFYILIASGKFDEKFMTNNAVTRVNVRSITGASPSFGYGLVVNSDITPINDDYAFLIKTDGTPAYRIVRHQNKKETTLKDWTPAAQIRSGTQTNQLEVRAGNKIFHFYINGQLVNSVPNEGTMPNGIVGIYTSDTVPIGFSNLEIAKN